MVLGKVFVMANICKKATSQIGDSSSAEDYLEAIIVLSREVGGGVRVSELSERLGVSKPSVSVAVRKLADAGLVLHERYGSIELTSTGRMRAEEIAARHDLIHKFLTEILGVNEETAQQDACRLEHDLSEEAVQLLAKFVAFLTGEGVAPHLFDRGFEVYLAEGKHHADLVGRG
jgi:DtxR family transcriptional regulator, Mn-dependent transcriptional regulator